jgi:hypothetical protein
MVPTTQVGQGCLPRGAGVLQFTRLQRLRRLRQWPPRPGPAPQLPSQRPSCWRSRCRTGVACSGSGSSQQQCLAAAVAGSCSRHSIAAAIRGPHSCVLQGALGASRLCGCSWRLPRWGSGQQALWGQCPPVFATLFWEPASGTTVLVAARAMGTIEPSVVSGSASLQGLHRTGLLPL